MAASSTIVRISFGLALLGVFACAQAAELGEPVVLSHVGQPLVADIELTALADPAQAVTVRLSSNDVYRGANIVMDPVLAGLNMTVMRREGRQFLHLTSVKPVSAEYVHLFLDLVDANKRNVRAATLWLSPDPNPAPVAPPPVAAKPAAIPAPDEPARAVRPAALVVRQPLAPAACPQQSAEQIKACAAIDYKNGLLSAQIVELEEKVKGLQLAMESRTKAAPATPAIKKPAPALEAPKPVPRPDSGFPWLLVVGITVLLAAIGAGVYFGLSRRKSKTVETAAADSVAWYARLASRFKRKPKPILAAAEEAPGDA